MTSDRKNQIIEEATRLFSRHGFDRVTIKQLAEICGITEPALYRHFDSKEALYEAVLDSLETRLQNRDLFARLEREISPTVILTDLARHIISSFHEHEELLRLFLFATLHEHGRARQVFRALRAPYVIFLNGQLIRLHREGRIRESNSDLIARCFVGMIFDTAVSATLWKEFQGKAYEPDEFLAAAIPIFVHGLAVTESGGGVS